MTDKKNDLTGLFEDVTSLDPKEILILSVTSEGQLNFNTNVPNYPQIHHILNRGVLEILLHERTSRMNVQYDTTTVEKTNTKEA